MSLERDAQIRWPESPHLVSNKIDENRKQPNKATIMLMVGPPGFEPGTNTL